MTQEYTTVVVDEDRTTVVEADPPPGAQATSAPDPHAPTHGVNGSDPVSLDASQIATGTFNAARIPSTFATDAEVSAAVAPLASSSALTAEQTARANADTAHAALTTSVHGIADTSQLVVTTDTRLSNARTPTLHAGTHAQAGTDPITIDAAQIASGTIADARIPSAITRDSEVALIVDGTMIDSSFNSGTNELTIGVDLTEGTGAGGNRLPVVAGGTGAGDAVSAMENLHGTYMVSYDPGATVSNDATEKTLYSSAGARPVFAGNTLTVGDRFELTVAGLLTNNTGTSTYTARLRVKFGTVAIIDVTTGTISTSAGPRGITLAGTFTVTNAGASGMVSSSLLLFGANPLQATPDTNFQRMGVGPSGAIDFTVSQTFDVTCQLSFAATTFNVQTSNISLQKSAV